jgi:hypothetical protein
MLNEIKNAIKESSLTPEVKKYILSLVFQDLASKEFNAHLADLEGKVEVPSKVDLDVSGGAE